MDSERGRFLFFFCFNLHLINYRFFNDSLVIYIERNDGRLNYEFERP